MIQTILAAGRLGSSLLLVRFVVFGLGTCASIVVARTLGPANFGAYAAAAAVAAAMEVLGAFGLDQLFLRGDIGEGALRRATGQLAAGQLLAVGLAALLWPHLTDQARVCTVLFGFVQATTIARLPWYLIPQRALQFRKRALREMVAIAATQITLVVSAVITRAPIAICTASVIVSTLLIGAGGARARDFTAGHFRETARLVLRGLGFAASGALYTVYFQIDAAILSALVAAVVVGQYAVAYAFVSAAVVLPVTLNNDILRPRLYRMSTELQRADLARQFGYICVALGVLAGVALYLAGPTVVRLLYGFSYASAAQLVSLLALCLPFHYVNSWAGNTLVALGRLRPVLWTQGALAVGNIVANIVVVPSRGASGAAVVTVATEAIGSLAYLCMVLPQLRAARRGDNY